MLLYHICAIASFISNACESSGTGGQNFDLVLYLHPYFVCASSEGSGEYVHLSRLARALAFRYCDRYQNLVHLLKCLLKINTLFFRNRCLYCTNQLLRTINYRTKIVIILVIRNNLKTTQ